MSVRARALAHYAQKGAAHMSLREFRDAGGREWMVWEVQPIWIERRRNQDSEVLAAVGELSRDGGVTEQAAD